jgi:hypothetical protein
LQRCDELLSMRSTVDTGCRCLLFASIFVLVIDLDRSYSGQIRVSQAPMVQAADRIARAEAAAGRP